MKIELNLKQAQDIRDNLLMFGNAFILLAEPGVEGAKDVVLSPANVKEVWDDEAEEPAYLVNGIIRYGPEQVFHFWDGGA